MFSIYKDDIEWIMKEAREKFPISNEQLLDDGAIFYNIGEYGTTLEYNYNKHLCFSIQYKDDTPYIVIYILPNSKVNVYIYGKCDGEDVCGRYKSVLKCVGTTELASIMCEIADKQGFKKGRCHIDELNWVEYNEALEKKNTFFAITEHTAKRVEEEEKYFKTFADNGRYTPFQEMKTYNYKDDCGRTATIISYKNVVFNESGANLIKSDTLTVYENGEKIVDRKHYIDFKGAKTALKRFSNTWQEVKEVNKA